MSTSSEPEKIRILMRQIYKRAATFYLQYFSGHEHPLKTCTLASLFLFLALGHVLPDKV